MADFYLYAPLLRQLEGGFVNDPVDAGGATMCGVTLATYQSVFGKDKTVDDLIHMRDTDWNLIMKTLYWDKIRGDDIRCQSVAEITADWAVNSGVKTAAMGVQRLLGVDADGIIGKKSLAAINNSYGMTLFWKIRDARKDYYYDLVEKRPSNAKFLNGWLNRLKAFRYR